MKRIKINKTILIVIYTFISVVSFASTGDAPWVSTMDKIVNILTGPTVKAISILAVCGLGVKMMFGNMEEGGKMGMKIAIGISIAFAAVSWVPSFFGFSGAALIM